MKTKLISYTILFILLLGACYKEVPRPLTVDFAYVLADSSHTVPISVNIANRSAGATGFKWSFEGGEPATSDYENPGAISFAQAGPHKITLEAWNDDTRSSKTIILQLDSAVQVTFDAEVQVNDFSPVQVKLTNHTTGASSYNWTFQDGDPASANTALPPMVTFTTPGSHTITLQVSNGGQQFTASKTITVKAPLHTDFTLNPGPFDDDYEAPLTAVLGGKSVSYLTQQWQCAGGVLDSDTASANTVYFANPGTYTVTLTNTNGKGSETVNKTITVKPNSHLRTITDVRLGISTAHTDIGCFYSTRLRKVYRKNDDLTKEGKEIDLVFFGLSRSFTYNKFVSPDSATSYTFPAIPGATVTRFINRQEQCNCGVSFSVSDFDNMQTDAPLQSLQLPANAIGGLQFDQTVLPRIILFQTADGRKGAIKIKDYVLEGNTAYIVADIKVQKYE
ncbi:PKD domain-containing protein [Chitinophaga ginsengisoli]|uniref:PKD repeat protein n=1 Tax=Chitinophaga ginsengisoli TaxID=363837 RepID=A0A2P8G9S1_9BACT|nr:PKD domain-containing protein [Chitinophaga ginsengisoli]PSL30717.1 PKD repeat protein [Chitinophaga ginsengisoli]